MSNPTPGPLDQLASDIQLEQQTVSQLNQAISAAWADYQQKASQAETDALPAIAQQLATIQADLAALQAQVGPTGPTGATGGQGA